ncbi:MAG: formate--tetrahydrofolate ligase [Bacilli bacterium]|nr:formate--tetrahydrofolate ligase [Bacilli bacterium]
MKSDIEIARECELKKITDVASSINIDENYLESYGKYKAKVDLDILRSLGDRKGKLILITSINPTPYGEGKTTMAIGIYDAFRKLGKNALLCLREPSLGPVFGIKGGATGGGYAQVVPMEDINLHFTGDIHAITAANNLLCAAIDNHIFQGNELNIDKDSITFQRCMDMNDRALRNITVSNNFVSKRDDSFNITAASEIMAILCLSTDLNDLKNRIANILFGFDFKGNPLYVSDLHVEEAMTILLKDAIKPNLVQTLEGNAVFIHGGPFANIAHGCNSVIATDLALRLSDYVITEAGFGADLGAEKFLNIKCRVGDFKPSAILVNATIRSLKYDFENKDVHNLEKGLDNLKIHIENMKKYVDNVLVCLNRFSDDSEEDINIIKNFCESIGVSFTICDAFARGGEGAIETANAIINSLDRDYDFNYIYDNSDSIKEKIEKVCFEIYRAKKVNFTNEALNNISKFEKFNLDKVMIAIAKSQYILGSGKEVTVKNVRLNNGAGFITVYLDDIMTMPGLSKKPAYLGMSIDEKGNISGLF